MKSINCRNKRILVCPDTHFPYAHKDWFRFLEAIKNKYSPDIYIHLGDEVDCHAMSMHPSDVDLYSAGDELEKAIVQLKRMEELFPRLHLCDSNHGSLAQRRFKLHGIPMKFLKPLQEIYGTPKWEWHESYILKTKIGDIYVCHGKSSIANKLSDKMAMSSIQGHYHGRFELTWSASATVERFSCFSGCLIDRPSLAFAYGKNHLPEPILGATIISKTGYPRLIKMHLKANGRWDGVLP